MEQGIFKTSHYNFFFPVDDKKFLAYNAMRNGLALIGEELKNAIISQENSSPQSIPGEILSHLIKGGFLIAQDVDELKILKIRRGIQQYSTNILGLTICPTLDCNLACQYCYETPAPGGMPKNVRTQVIEFVKNYIESGTKTLGITWYGGEPLLYFDIIEELSNELIKLCESKNVNYSSFIITNGTKYTRDIAKKLKQLKVNGAQITIDGNKKIHDKRKPFKNGDGSFDLIIKNIEDAAGVLPISIRVNVDKSNSASALDFLKNLQTNAWYDNKNISAHLGYVIKATPACKCSEDECLKPGDFWRNTYEVHQFFQNSGYNINPYPKPIIGCGATTTHAFVVGPDGNLYKCYNNIGMDELKIGSIFDPIQFNPLYTDYLTEGFENDEECLKCKVLPICMGGCIDLRIKHKRGEIENKNCSEYKSFLPKALKLFYLSKKQTGGKIESQR